MPECENDSDGITLEQIALLTDFPEDFIKRELLMNRDQISMSEFRTRVLEYLAVWMVRRAPQL